MNQDNTGGLRCHDADACAFGQKPCPTPEMCGCAPQAVQPAAPMFWVRLLRDGLYEGPVHNNSAEGKLLRDEKPAEWHPLYLQAAPAHPADGVQQDQEHWCAYVAGALGCHLGWPVDDQREKALSNIIKNRLWCLPPAATQPAAQGLDALIEQIHALPTVRAPEIDGEESDGTPKHWRNRPFVSRAALERLLRAVLAAQAKQGGA